MKYDFIAPRQFSDRVFREHRFLIDCHIYDSSEPWYKKLSEVVYRPWGCSFPVPSGVPGLSLAWCITAQGKKLDGYICLSGVSSIDNDELPIIEYRPCFYGSRKFWQFWHGSVYQFGMEGVLAAKDALERECKAKAEEIFPVQIISDEGVLENSISFEIAGFGYYSDANWKSSWFV